MDQENWANEGPMSGQRTVEERLQAVTLNDAVVHSILQSGGSLAECVIALYEQKEHLLKELTKAQLLTPARYRVGGTVFRYDPPDEVIPLVEL